MAGAELNIVSALDSKNYSKDVVCQALSHKLHEYWQGQKLEKESKLTEVRFVVEHVNKRTGKELALLLCSQSTRIGNEHKVVVVANQDGYPFCTQPHGYWGEYNYCQEHKFFGIKFQYHGIEHTAGEHFFLADRVNANTVTLDGVNYPEVGLMRSLPHGTSLTGEITVEKCLHLLKQA